MRGKKTYRDGPHPSRVGGLVEPVSIGKAEWAELEGAIGPLNDVERQNIADYCALLRSVWQEDKASAADIRVTLDSIADELDAASVIQAFKNCDAATETQIDLFLYQLDGPDFFKILPALPTKQQATKIRAAACLASRAFKPSTGASVQSWQRLAAEYAIQLSQWRDIPTTAHAFIEDDETQDPVILVLQNILGIVNPVDSPQSVSWCVKLIGAINARAALGKASSRFDSG
ncbi:MAG: hypothetical protein U1F63_03200 [Chitinivorax sp.]